MESNWVECVVDNDYEINTLYPYQIRRKSDKRIISESVKSTSYVRCELNERDLLKHRIIAMQFIPNDEPEKKMQVDHIGFHNHVSNLRWVTQSENFLNKSSRGSITYEYVDDIPNDAIEVLQYSKYYFVDYYFVDYYFVEEDAFYFWNGIKFRRLHVCYDKRGYAFVNAHDTRGKVIKIMYAKFKREYGLV